MIVSLCPKYIPNKFKKYKDVILTLLRNSYAAVCFYDEACI